MGSLKDEMRGLGEDRKPCEKADDGERPGGSDGSAAPEGPQINTSQESASHGDHQPKRHMNANYGEEGDKNPISKDQVLLGGVCEQSDSGVKDPTQSVAVPLMQQPDKSTAASCNDTTISEESPRDGESDTGHDREKEAEIESISVPVPATPGPSDPWSPAPAGQHHMRTQVSLEVVQCRSAATSPMTPPQDGQSFFFPSSFGRSGAKDAELQVGQQVEFCSVATSPMTPKTPSTSAFPELIGRETARKEEGVGKSDEGQGQSGHNESLPVTKSEAKAESETNGALKFSTTKELSEGFGSNASPESSAGCPAAGFVGSQGSPEEGKEQPKQQRMGSMDQDITILVTHYDNKEEEEEEDSSVTPVEPEMVKIDEYEEPRESYSEENISTETVAPDLAQDNNPPQTKPEGSVASATVKADVKSDNSEVNESKRAREDLRDVSVTKPPVPESPAPFGCQNIRTQVSLEVVQCQSVATSPMTPPEGDHAFYFPSSIGRSAAMGAETRDAEMQVGQQVEFRSVATAPMTPRTPTTTAFPEITKGASVEEKIVEEEEVKKEQVVADKEELFEKEEEVAKEEQQVEAAEEDTKEAKNCKEKVEEPVQEVSWDEKGMTWEVYGAVVEVTVLGSAIQKHLEKQVKKRQPSMPPPPPLKPSAVPLSAEPRGGSGSGKGRTGKRGEQDGEVSRRRRNPFRLMMENMQQPHCCSKAHTTE